MAFDENNYEMPPEGDDLPEESNNNRTFMIAVGIIGGLILISAACFGLVYVLSSRGTTAADQDQAARATQTAIAAQSFINQALTATFQASILPTATQTSTPTSTPPLSLPSPTSTFDPASTAATNGTLSAGSAGTQVAATSTVAAALTQAAAAQKTVVAIPSPTRLAGTGIADEYGLPGLFVMALAFIIVIMFARRLRVAPAR